MKLRWSIMGAATGLLVAAPIANAHELECEKTVNGRVYEEVDEYPTTLRYRLTIRNTHPNQPSEVLKASDPLLESLGFPGFDTPFTIPVKGSVSETFNVRLESFEDCLKVARKDGARDRFIDNTFTVGWDRGKDVCQARVKCEEPRPPPPPPPPPPGLEGRMTGGGSVFGQGRNRVTHGFQLRCDADDPRQNLEINWGRPANRFHLLDLTFAECTDDPNIDEGRPIAGFDTFRGRGTGRYNGVDGATVEFIFTDAGEPGRNDRARILIRDAGGNVVLDVDGTLQFGNHQAHRN